MTRTEKRLGIVLFIIVLSLSTFSSFFHPIFNPYDEIGHFAYIQQISHDNTIPSYLLHNTPHDCIHEMAAGQCPSATKCYERRAHLEHNEISIHSPWYYRLHSIPYTALSGNVCSAFYGVRLSNSFLFAVLTTLSFLLLSKIFTPLTAFLSMFWVGTNPNLLARSSTVTDDLLPGLSVAIALYLLFHRRSSALTPLLIGLLGGFTFVSKYTAYMVVPFFGIALIVLSSNQGKLRIGKDLLLFLLGSLLPISLQIGINLDLYGELFFTDMRGAMGELPRDERPNTFLEHPEWILKWFAYYWIDSWTSFYDWSSGFLVDSENTPNFNLHELPIGRLYLIVGALLFIGLLHTIYKEWRNTEIQLKLLLILGVLAPISKFLFDLYMKTPYPAIRFGFPYLVGLAAILPFILLRGEKTKNSGNALIALLILMNLGQLLLGAVRNILGS